MSNKITLKNYDKFASLYSSVTYNIVMQYQLNMFESFLAGKKILDVGTGSGRDAEYLVNVGYDVTAIDASKQLLKHARKLAKGPKYRLMDMNELKFKKGSFDGIWCNAVLLHEKRKNVEKILRKFHDVLKVGGLLFASVKEGKTEGYVESPNLGGAKVWTTYYTQIDFEAMIIEAGFELVKGFIEEHRLVKWINVFARKV